MAVRSRPHRDLGASFQRLRRLVVDVKSARRSLAAQHGLIADLVSVALYPSTKDPLLHPFDLQQDHSPPESPLPLSRLHPDRPSRLPLQSGELRTVSAETQIPRPISFSSSKASKKASSLAFRSTILKLFALLSFPLAEISSTGIREENSSRRKTLAPGAYPGKRFSQPAFWMPLLAVFVCFFLYTGKEIAVVVAISMYSIIWVARKIRIVLRDFFSSGEASDSASCRSRKPCISSGCKAIGDSSSDSQGSPKVQSLPAHCVSSEKGSCLKDSDDSRRPGISPRTIRGTESSFPTMKLSVILILALCGLDYSYLIAVCLCSFCIVLLSVKQELAKRICLRHS